jgi:hypothetical protein
VPLQQPEQHSVWAWQAAPKAVQQTALAQLPEQHAAPTVHAAPAPLQVQAPMGTAEPEQQSWLCPSTPVPVPAQQVPDPPGPKSEPQAQPAQHCASCVHGAPCAVQVAEVVLLLVLDVLVPPVPPVAAVEVVDAVVPPWPPWPASPWTTRSGRSKAQPRVANTSPAATTTVAKARAAPLSRMLEGHHHPASLSTPFCAAVGGLW